MSTFFDNSPEYEDSPEKLDIYPGSFVILRGLPGSGKSTLLSKLSEKYNFKLIDPDEVYIEDPSYVEFCQQRSKEDSGFDDLPEATRKYRYNMQQALDSLNDGVPVIWAQPWSSQEGIEITLENTYELTSNPSDLFPIVVELDLDRDIAKERVNSRYDRGEHGLDVDTFDLKFYDDYQKYTLRKDIPYISLNGSNTIEENYNYLSLVLEEIEKHK